MILDKINQLLKEVSQLSAKNADDIEQLRLKYLSKKINFSKKYLSSLPRTQTTSSNSDSSI